MLSHWRPATLALLALTAIAAAGVTPPAQAQPAPAAPGPMPAMSPAPGLTPGVGPAVTPMPAMTPTLVSPAPAVTPTPAASPGSSPSPLADVPNPPENPLVTARVRREFLAWQHGRINRSTYSPAAGGTYIDAYVSVVAPDLAIGDVQSVQYQTAALLLGDLVYRYSVTGAGGAVSVLYALDSRGKTDGISFTPEVFRTGANTP